MSKVVTEPIVQTTTVNAEIKRKITEILIESSLTGTICWVVSPVTNDDNEDLIPGADVYYYSYPTADLAMVNPQKGSMYADIQTTLWEKTEEIDAMPNLIDSGETDENDIPIMITNPDKLAKKKKVAYKITTPTKLV